VPHSDNFKSLSAVFRRLSRNKGAMVGLIVVMLFLLTALFAPVIAPHDPDQADFARILKAPTKENWLGTDELGRDMLSRLIHGARLSITIGVISVSIGVFVGVPLGLMSGYYGGIIDLLMQRVTDIMMAFPAVLLAILMVAVFGAGLYQLMVAVGIVSIPIYIRLVRGSTLSVREEDYVLAARAAGAGDLRILFVHILPNCMAPILVQSTLQVATAIISAAALGFLGLGPPPNIPEWGSMLSKGRTFVFSAPHVTTFPGLSIVFVVLGFNLLGDGLRDALDPRLKK
jgi:peptide/nickel transport system permease protein